MSDFCAVAEAGCKAPAGWRNNQGITHGTVKTKLECSVCGNYVCTNCSTGRGKKRRCADCTDEANRKAAKTVVKARIGKAP